MLSPLLTDHHLPLPTTLPVLSDAEVDPHVVDLVEDGDRQWSEERILSEPELPWSPVEAVTTLVTCRATDVCTPEPIQPGSA